MRSRGNDAFGMRMAAYSASKFAVTGYDEVLRRKLASEKVNVALIFPAGMATRHLESSIAARPAELGGSRIEMDDVQAMIADVGIDPASLIAIAEHAIRNLLDCLDAGHPDIITHGTYCRYVKARHRNILGAFDQMTANP